MADRQVRPDWEAANRRDRVNMNAPEPPLEGPLASHAVHHRLRDLGWTGEIPAELDDKKRLAHMVQASASGLISHPPDRPPTYREYLDTIEAIVDREVRRGHRAIRELRHAAIVARDDATDATLSTVRDVITNLEALRATSTLKSRDKRALATRVSNEVQSLRTAVKH